MNKSKKNSEKLNKFSVYECKTGADIVSAIFLANKELTHRRLSQVIMGYKSPSMAKLIAYGEARLSFEKLMLLIKESKKYTTSEVNYLRAVVSVRFDASEIDRMRILDGVITQELACSCW